MRASCLRCINCGQVYELGLVYHCINCDFPLDVVYDSISSEDIFEDKNKTGIWRFGSAFPLVEEIYETTLGEGNTPLLNASNIGQRYGIPNLYIKNEGQNPTGSFKDRPTALGVSLALSFGVDTVIVSSTGNAGASLAAYGAKSGLRTIILVPESTPRAKLTQMDLYGATVIPVKGSISEAFWLAYNASQKWKWMNLTSTFLYPYGVEGDKTVAYEIFMQLGKVPDWIVVPVSVGPLLVGIYKGFRELKERNLVDTLPRMIAAQAANCAPITLSYDRNDTFVQSWLGSTKTIANGIADPLLGYTNDATYTLRIIRESGGIATASDDEQILEANLALAKYEGLLIEPSSAVAVSALHMLKERENFASGDTVVLVLTGNGLKQLRMYETNMNRLKAITPDLEELSSRLT